MRDSVRGRRLGHLDGAASTPFQPGIRGDRQAATWSDDQPRGWQQRAACRELDQQPFFPNRELTPPPDWLVTLCAACPVRGACLEAAVKTQAVGYWAATSTEQRKRLG